ncbi:MAG: NPCBM/NEW2 domain-containing protein [Candidatus Fimenecus sp.]
MFCKKCGASVNNNQKFCPVCGEAVNALSQPSPLAGQEKKQSNIPPVSPIHTPKKAEKQKKRISKKTKAIIILCSIAAVILSVAIAGAVLFFTGPAYEVYSQMKDGDYEDAADTYLSDVEDNFLQKAFSKAILKNYPEKILNDYQNAKLDFDQAMEALDALAKMGYNTESAADTITKSNASKKAFELANEYYEDGDYENAIREFSKITDDSEKYGEAQTQLTELYSKYTQTILDSASNSADSGNFKDAVSLIGTALELVPAGSENANKLNSAAAQYTEKYKEQVLAEASEMINGGKYIEAISLLDDAITYNENDDFKNMRTTAEKKYVETVTASVNDYLAKEDYISASRTVNDAVSKLPASAELKALQKKVQDATPTYLLDVCKPYETYHYVEFVNGEKFSMGGTEYTNGFTLSTDNSGYTIFNLNSNYSTVSFNLGHVDGSGMNTSTVKIYCDEVLKEEYVIESGSLPKRITLDVTGVKQFKITVDNYYDAAYGFGNVIVK